MKVSRKIQRQVELVIRHAMVAGELRPEPVAEREPPSAKPDALPAK